MLMINQTGEKRNKRKKLQRARSRRCVNWTSAAFQPSSAVRFRPMALQHRAPSLWWLAFYIRRGRLATLSDNNALKETVVRICECMRETKMRVSCAFFNAHSKQRTHTYTNREMNTNALLSLSLLEMCLYGASKKTRSYFSKKDERKEKDKSVWWRFCGSYKLQKIDR